MKTHTAIEIAARRPGTRLPVFMMLSMALVAPALAADPSPPKNHALFVGATLRVECEGGFRELVGATESSVLLLADGKLQEMRRDAVSNVRIEMGLKLSDVVVQIDKMEVKPTFVPSNAQRMDSMRQQSLLSDMAAQRTDMMAASASRMSDADGTVAVVAWVAASNPSLVTPAMVATAKANLSAAENGFSAAQSASLSTQSLAASMSSGRAAVNALAINCLVSAPKLTHKAYAMVVTEFRETADSKSSYKVHIEPIGDLDSKPRRLSMTQNGLPAGFVLGQVVVHLFVDGQEMATNLSEQRVDLTADDAMRYLVLCYIASHSKDSLVASPLRIALPADFKQQAPAADLERTLYLNVGMDGLVQGVSCSSDHAVAADTYIDSAVRKFRYNPALKEGKPVESVVELQLASLLR